jgi:predicted nucleic acid-binding protein
MSASVVIDASAFVRSARGSEEASSWIERIELRQVQAFAPELIYAEAANALLLYSRKQILGLDHAEGLLDVLRRLPIRVVSLRELAVPALRLADQRGLSAYDACYVALSEEAEAPLLTADAAVAAAAADSILLA